MTPVAATSAATRINTARVGRPAALTAVTLTCPGSHQACVDQQSNNHCDQHQPENGRDRDTAYHKRLLAGAARLEAATRITTAHAATTAKVAVAVMPVVHHDRSSTDRADRRDRGIVFCTLRATRGLPTPCQYEHDGSKHPKSKQFDEADRFQNAHLVSPDHQSSYRNIAQRPRAGDSSSISERFE